MLQGSIAPHGQGLRYPSSLPSLVPLPLALRALAPRANALLSCSYTTNVTHVPGRIRTALVAIPL